MGSPESGWQGHVDVPSLIGCYTHAVLCGDMEHAAEHHRQLSSAEPPVMQAELIIVRVVFESLIRLTFTSPDDEAIDAFVTRLPAASEHVVSRDEARTVIKRSLTDHPVRYRGFDPDRLDTVWTVVSAIIVRDRRLDSASIGDLVLHGEHEAARRGIHLAPAPASSCRERYCGSSRSTRPRRRRMCPRELCGPVGAAARGMARWLRRRSGRG